MGALQFPGIIFLMHFTHVKILFWWREYYDLSHTCTLLAVLPVAYFLDLKKKKTTNHKQALSVVQLTLQLIHEHGAHISADKIYKGTKQYKH